MLLPDIPVAATDQRFYGLKHPSGRYLDSVGFGLWPQDSFTFALIREGALERSGDIVDPPIYEPTTSEAFYFVRDGVYIYIAATDLAEILAPLLGGTSPEPQPSTTPLLSSLVALGAA